MIIGINPELINSEAMKIYTVYLNPRKPAPYENAVFVEERFSWLGFFVPLIWAIYNRVWSVVAFMAVFMCLAGAMIHYDESTAGPMKVIALIINLYVGLNGNDMIRKRLSRQGYILANIISGDKLINAQQRFFSNLAPSPLSEGRLIA